MTDEKNLYLEIPFEKSISFQRGLFHEIYSIHAAVNLLFHFFLF